MHDDYILNEIIEENRLVKRNKIKKRAIAIIAILSIAILLWISNIVFADHAIPIVRDENGNQYIYFEIDHTITTAKYKYYGYGYTISVHDDDTDQFLTLEKGSLEDKTQYFMNNTEFKPIQNGSKETVEIPMENIFDQIGVNEEFYWHNNLTVYLNARMGIRVDGLLTHLYDTLEGSSAIGLNTIPIGTYNPGKYNPKENHSTDYIATKKNGDESVYPETMTGYNYINKYQIDVIDKNDNKTLYKAKTEGASCVVPLKQAEKRYIVTFYYEEDIQQPPDPPTPPDPGESGEDNEIPDGNHTKYRIKYLEKSSKKEIDTTTEYI